MSALPQTPSAEDRIAMAKMEARWKPVVMLQPRRVESPLPPGTSKMGGSPELPRNLGWPKCPHCRVWMDFVLQLYQRDFPDFPFPPDRDQFMLFRCPREHCASRSAIGYLTWRFFPSVSQQPRAHPAPEKRQKKDHPPVNECRFQPLQTGDYPCDDDATEWWGETYDDFFARHIDTTKLSFVFSPVFQDFEKRVATRTGTKIGGFASWQQGTKYPICSCGRRMEFVFQLASDDRDPEREKSLNENAELQQSGIKNAAGRRIAWPPYWSDHGIMIGDLGNVYFFSCPECGPTTLQTNWDCG